MHIAQSALLGFRRQIAETSAGAHIFDAPVPATVIFLSGGEEGLGLSSCGESAQCAIIGVVFSGFRRAERDKLVTLLLNYNRPVVALIRRHVTRAAERTIVITHGRPFIEPCSIATFAEIVITEPSQFRINPSIANGSSRAIGSRDSLGHGEIEVAGEFFA